jgi:hypothetical protein
MNLCSRNMHVYLPRPEVEAMLLGKVILDPEHEAQMMLLFEELEERMDAQAHAPHRRRGRL